MFRHIMVPVDLANTDRLARALEVTADAARHYHARVTYVSASNTAPTEVADAPDEFRRKLGTFAAGQAQEHGIEAEGHALILPDARSDLDGALVETAREVGADLVIMASHDPGIVDHFWSSNGGAVARHSDASVMLVRGD
ncbi:universal stress protein [Roseivivax isoporae]|uniref:Universal stress protein UspA n=1 Tax=Roseivivax isoporae LMG 25204 TaxID=1449351 RepID=X7FC25_9RHOB|nr:universal stress protein [Roseivivax isoporae]ETX30462.1 universal stress protein UspA [Roseivivax isoporae LMG 25204]